MTIVYRSELVQTKVAKDNLLAILNATLPMDMQQRISVTERIGFPAFLDKVPNRNWLVEWYEKHYDAVPEPQVIPVPYPVEPYPRRWESYCVYPALLPSYYNGRSCCGG